MKEGLTRRANKIREFIDKCSTNKRKHLVISPRSQVEELFPDSLGKVRDMVGDKVNKSYDVPKVPRFKRRKNQANKDGNDAPKNVLRNDVTQSFVEPKFTEPNTNGVGASSDEKPNETSGSSHSQPTEVVQHMSTRIGHSHRPHEKTPSEMLLDL